MSALKASTTIAAFRSLHVGPLRDRILSAIESFGPDGCIGDEVRDAFLAADMKDGSLNTRYSELENAGLIFRNGDTRAAASGRQQLVMRHIKYLGSTPVVPITAKKAKRNPFVSGMMFAARVVIDTDPSLKGTPVALALKRAILATAKR